MYKEISHSAIQLNYILNGKRIHPYPMNIAREADARLYVSDIKTGVLKHVFGEKFSI